tara:strand:+ start:1461 stop:1724 length:264 start_codon:yes stop_codon:yes gene_type:complete
MLKKKHLKTLRIKLKGIELLKNKLPGMKKSSTIKKWLINKKPTDWPVRNKNKLIEMPQTRNKKLIDWPEKNKSKPIKMPQLRKKPTE